ncbi:hypothetical protein CEXT_364361 [Caerostris extrusa]|uniref:Uncharacterized protein n=1 Tax=Caerostris extrusa TaxID=172846 RepID=A0AAV4M5J8_CAEEX|nr:hypothetical protein CEXT_364361 [Caerostris extrusa]
MCHPHLVECPPFGSFCFAKASPPSKRWESVFYRSALRKFPFAERKESAVIWTTNRNGHQISKQNKGSLRPRNVRRTYSLENGTRCTFRKIYTGMYFLK